MWKPKYIYSLYRLDTWRNPENKRLKPMVFYFNSCIREHRVTINNAFKKENWLENIETHVYERMSERSLQWTHIIHFRSKFAARIAKLFARVMMGHTYTISRLEVE